MQGIRRQDIWRNSTSTESIPGGQKKKSPDFFLVLTPSSNSAETLLAHTARGTATPRPDMITLLDHTPQPHRFT